MRRYRRPLDRFAAAIVGGRSEDVTQDAFSKALLALRGSETEIELRPWLYRIVRNTALNDVRGRPPVAEELSDTVPGGRSAAAEAEAREEIKDLMERLGALPEPQRAALVMRELEGLSHEEIAAALGVSGGAARQAIFRARVALRDGLGLLVPMPVLRALIEQGGDAARAGGAIAAGAGASSAGGAALGGLGGGALKAGVAAVLIAGSVGAGVAIDHRQGDPPGPEAAEAAALPSRGANGMRRAAPGNGGESTSQTSGRDGNDDADAEERGRGDDSGGQDGVGLGDEGGRSGPGDGSGGSGSGSGSGHSGGGGSGEEGPGANSGPGSISGGGGGEGGDRSGPDSGEGFEDGSGSSGSSGDDGGSSGSGGDGSSSGPGSGEVETEPVLPPEPVIDGGGGNSGSGSESSGEGSGDLSGETGNGSLDESP